MMAIRACLQLLPLMLLWACCQATGAEPLGDADTIEYRRYFVPHDRPQDWPKGEIPYVPIEKEEFERLVTTLQSAPQAALGSSARVARASYAAKLVEPELLSGQAKLDLVHAAEAPVLLPLDPWGLAIDGVRWDDKESPEALFGLASDGRPAVYVDRSATLLIDWSVRGHRDTTGSVAFGMELPRSPFSSLEINLPPGLSPSTSAGVLVAAAAGQWRIELGGENHCLLKLSPAATQQLRPLALLQQVTRYDFSPGGLDVTAELTLDVHNDPLQRLELDVDSDLQLMSARFGDLDVPWSVASPGESGGKSRIVVEFPQPLLGPRQQVQLKALAPLAAERLWKLPGIRPQGVFWQEGSTLLLVPAPLSLDRLLPIGCRESRTSTLPAPLSGESVELQAFSPSAAVNVLISRRVERLRLASAVQAEISPDQLNGTWVGEFRVERGERLSLSADIQQGWVVDSVVSLSEGDVASNNLAPLDLEGRLLTVHLARAISPDHPVRLKISAHAVASPQERPVRAGEFRMLAFRDVGAERRSLALQARPPFQLRFEGAEDQPRREADSLTPEEREWLADAPAGSIFDVSKSPGSWTLQLEEQPPRFAAELKVEATLTQNALLESYLVRCLPESAAVNRCLVHFSQARNDAPRWSMDAAGPDEIAAHRCTPEQELAAGLGHGETWEVVFNRPHGEPFEFRAVRSTAITGALPLCLITLPDATRQQGRVEVRLTDAVPALISNHRLKPLPLPPVPDTEYPVVRGDYRYDPAGELISSAGPAITVSRSSAAEQLQGAFVWDLLLESQFEAAGRGIHLATCRIESYGRPRCSLQLSRGAEVLGVWVDNQSLRWSAINGRLVVPLPRGKRFPTIQIQFETSGPRLAAWSAIEAPWPQVDMAVLVKRWQVWAPPEFDLLSPNGVAAGIPALSWSQRLFGILGRPSREAPFQPTLSDAWPGFAAATPIGRQPIAGPPPDSVAMPAASVWPAFAHAGSRKNDRLYWHAYQFDPVDGMLLKVRFIDHSLVLAVGWTALALAFALARWLLRGKLATLACLAGAVACSGLLLPEALAPVVSGVLIALLTALLVDLFSPQHSGGPKSNTPVRHSPARLTEALVLAAVIGAGSFGANLAAGQEAAPTAKPERQERFYRVFIPSDANGKPVGGRYQIPQAFRSELRRRAMVATGEPNGWIIADAAYTVLLGRNEEDSRLNVVDFTVRYQLQVLSPNTRLRIPLSRERASLAPDSALLDNLPVEPYWEEGGQALLCDAPEPGRYTFEFKLRPVVASSVDHNSLELLIPPVPSATLALHAPPDASGIEVPGAIGPLSWSENRDLLSAKLGPASRLTVRWPQRMGGPEPTVEVDELLWLKVRPGSVVVDARLQYHVSGGQVRQLALAADRRFRLIPPGPDSPVAQFRSSPNASDMADSPQTIQMELSEPIADKLTLPISLLLTETSGIGNIRLPMLEPQGARSRRRWLAVSVDSGLEVTVQNDETLERVDAAEFVADWGKTEPQPLLAYRLPPGDTPWNLATRPREPHTTVKQVLAVSFDRGSAELRFDGELMTTAGYCFQHRLFIPKELAIDSVSLQADGAERVLRWARDDEGMLNVFLSSRTTGSQHLTLLGRLPTPNAGKFPLPTIRIEGADALPQGDVVQVFRQPAVLVSVEDRLAAAEAPEPPRDKTPEEFGRPVVALAALTGDFSAQVVLAPNEPLVDCVQVTMLEYEDQVWNAKVEHRLNIERGVVDVLRFEIPPEWTGPFETTPPANVEVTDDLVQGRRRLLVRPRTALAKGQHRVAVRSPLAFVDNTQVMVPDIRPLQSGSEERFVVLPTQVGVEQVTWETTRLVPAELPAGFSAPFVSPEAFEVYRIVGEKPQAVLSAVQRSAEMARIRLADYQFNWHPDGVAHVTASFDLEPTGLSTCPLRLPRDWLLVQASVAGIPVAPEQVADGWRLPLAANRLPQRIQITASGAAGDATQVWTSLQLPAPTLGALPVEQTLWTLYSPPGWQCEEFGKTALRIDSLDSQRYRLRSIAAVVSNLSSDTAATTAAAELENWRRTWARRLALLKTDLDRQRQAFAQHGDATTELDSLDQEWSEIAKNSELAMLAQELIKQQPLRDQPAELWDQVQSGEGSATHFVVRQEAAPPQVRFVRVGQSGLLRRLTAAAGVALATLLLVAILRSGMVVEFLRRWPSAAGVAAGLAWWLWLSPSVVGWLLILVSLAGAFRRPWHSVREPGSTIVPLSSLKG